LYSYNYTNRRGVRDPCALTPKLDAVEVRAAN
jgi:hypothetical protein